MADYLNTSDEELISLCKQDDSAALDALTCRYMHSAGNIACYLGVPANEVSDYVQEGMIGFLSAVYSYDETKQAKFSTYACACIKNRMLSVLRKAAAKSNIPSAMTVSLEEQSQNLLSDLTPEQQIISEKNVRDILCAIDALTQQEQAAFRLFLAGMRYEEIAAELSISAKAVDGTLQRARKKLRKALSSNMPDSLK